MWRCTNGHPNYWLELEANFHGRENCIQGRWFLLPAVELQQWQESILASNKTLGTVYHTISLTIHFLRWELELYVARTFHTKTQQEIDSAMNR